MELNSKKIYTILIVDGNDVKWLVESIYLAIENGKSGFERIYEYKTNIFQYQVSVQMAI